MKRSKKVVLGEGYPMYDSDGDNELAWLALAGDDSWACKPVKLVRASDGKKVRLIAEVIE